MRPVFRNGIAVHQTPTMRLAVHPAPDWSTPPRLEGEWSAGGMSGRFAHGDADPSNLCGPVGALDTVGSHNLPTLPPSLLTRRGAAILDDSRGPALDAHGFPVRREQSETALDLYVFVYGHDYRRALRDLVCVAAAPPLPPRGVLGLWYSRFWRHTDRELLDVADRFASEGMPLDVLVLDVDWHLHGWEGYDWDPECFPDPAGFMAELSRRRVLSSFNVHPWVPLLPADTHHAECRRRLWRTVGEDEGIVFDHVRRDEATVAYEVLRQPIDELGCDMWWIDGAHAKLDGVDAQLLTNHAFLHFAEGDARRRPAILARYGGLGSHRQGIGFSGDTHSHWAVLRYQVMLTARSANQAYGLWSHDVGGHLGRRLDTELLVRWVQAASLWPVLRLHSDHGERLPWDYGDVALDACRRAVQQRLCLVPYLYDLQVEAHETGLSMYRPMYVDWPECDEAYDVDDQAMVGGALLHAPVCARGREPGGAALRSVWLPPGEWHDLRSGVRTQGGRTVTVRAALSDTPLFARAGGIVVTQPEGTRGADAAIDPLGITVFAGASGEHVHVDDDGVSRAFESGALARTPIGYDEARAEVAVGPASVDHHVAPAQRTLLVQLAGVDAADEVSVEGGTILERQVEGWAPRGPAVLVRADDLRTSAVRVRFAAAREDAEAAAKLVWRTRVSEAAVAAGEHLGAVRAAAAEVRTGAIAACARLLVDRMPEPVAADAVCALGGAGLLNHAVVEGLTLRVRAMPVAGDDVDVVPGVGADAEFPLGDTQSLDVHVHRIDAQVVVCGGPRLRLQRELRFDQTSVRHLALLPDVPIPDDDVDADAAPDGLHDLAAPGWQLVALPPPADPLDDPVARLDLTSWGWLDVPRTFFYVAARLETGVAQDVVLRLPVVVADPSQLRLWVDGARIDGSTRPLLDHPDEHVFPVRLDAGAHDVLVRIVHPQYVNYLAMRVTAPDGAPAHDLRALPPQIRA